LHNGRDGFLGDYSESSVKNNTTKSCFSSIGHCAEPCHDKNCPGAGLGDQQQPNSPAETKYGFGHSQGKQETKLKPGTPYPLS
jgi:hypothetical protein